MDTSGDARRDTTVVVHVDSPEAVELQRQDEAGTWRPVCISPCDRPFAEHDRYRVAGDGLRASGEFTLQGHDGRIAIAVRPSSNGWVTGGVLLISLGGATALAGAFATAILAPLQGFANDVGAGRDDPSSTANAGVVMMVVGAVAIVGGILALGFSRPTDVTARDASVDQTVAPPPPRATAAWAHVSRLEPALPTPTWVPLFVQRF